MSMAVHQEPRNLTNAPDSVDATSATRAAHPADTPALANPVVLFDGVCNLCNGSVDFVLKWERVPRLRFASLQSDEARRLLAERSVSGASLDPGGGTSDAPRSIILIDGEGVHTQSTAALRIARELRAPWSALHLLHVIPRPLRDLVYRWVARNRYTWFGRRESCRVPTPELRHRFLDGIPGTASTDSLGRPR